MARKSSFSAKAAEVFAVLHNSRVLQPDYLITNKNILEIDYGYNHTKLMNKIQQDYEKHKKQKWQEQFKPIHEAVVNLKEDTSRQELISIKRRLENEFGVTVTNITAHYDEGHFILENEDGEEFKIDRKFNNKFKHVQDGSEVTAEIKYEKEYWEESKDKHGHTVQERKTKTVTEEMQGKLKREFNYHAHIIYNRYDFKNHRMIKLDNVDMIKIQDITAECLNMERGVRGSKKKRLEHHNFSKSATQKANSLEDREVVIDKNLTIKKSHLKKLFKPHRTLLKEISGGNMSKADWDNVHKSLRDFEFRFSRKEFKNNSEVKSELGSIFKEHIKEHVKTMPMVGKYITIDDFVNEFQYISRDIMRMLDNSNFLMNNEDLLNQIQTAKEDLELQEQKYRKLWDKNQVLEKNLKLVTDENIKLESLKLENEELNLYISDLEHENKNLESKIKTHKNLEVENSKLKSEIGFRNNQIKELEIKLKYANDTIEEKNKDIKLMEEKTDTSLSDFKDDNSHHISQR